ncbi:MAG: metallophosphoesterase, partial [Balneolales bacterium]
MIRREWLKSVGTSGLAIAAGGSAILESETKRIDNRVLRIAHMTDQHVDDLNSESWTQTCIQQIHNLEDQPDLIINGGDTIGDALGQQEDSVTKQWNIWKRLQQDITLPIVHCIGNHDVWGVREYENDPRYAKQWAVKELGLQNRYYDFERNGWHFIVLDSTHLKADGGWYTAKLDEEQFNWLEQRLTTISSDTPIFIVSHIPIMCAASFFDGDNEKSGNWQI